MKKHHICWQCSEVRPLHISASVSNHSPYSSHLIAIPSDLNRAFQFWSRINKQGGELQKQTLVIIFFGKSIKSDGKHIPERGYYQILFIMKSKCYDENISQIKYSIFNTCLIIDTTCYHQQIPYNKSINSLRSVWQNLSHFQFT